MKFTLLKRNWWAGALLACVALCGQAAYAGIPHPGLLLYGKVIDEGGTELHTGELVFTFTPAAGGDAVELRTALTTIVGNGGPYAYRLVVPFEIGIPSEAVSTGALPLPDGTAQYVRAGSLEGTPVAMSHVVDINASDASSVFRVDVCIGCKAVTPIKHSTDINDDYAFSLSELLRTIELHTATPSHEYHVDPTGRDGYGTGAGAENGLPHTADYDNGSDWVMSGHEIVRVIDLFTSTPEHGYDVDATQPDGFRKANIAPVLNSSKAMLGDGVVSGVITHRSVSGGAVGATPGLLNITVTVDGSPEGDVSGLGVTDTLPAGWHFAGLEGKGPGIAPKAGAKGVLDFVAFPVPALPYTFSYSVQTPGRDLATQYAAYTATGYYRLKTGNLEKAMPVEAQLSIGLSPDLDTDGDGISDAVEGTEDSDHDGIPNFLDVDDDNDGLTDAFEAGMDGNAEYDPYNPLTNPNGRDGDITNPDMNGNGRVDGVDVSHGVPVVLVPKSVPLAGGLGLAVLAVALAGAASRRRAK